MMYFCGICSCFILGGRVKSSIETTTNSLGAATVCANKGGVWDATHSQTPDATKSYQAVDTNGDGTADSEAHCWLKTASE